MKVKGALEPDDAIRLLRLTIEDLETLKRTGEFAAKEFKTAGEMLLEEALLYLASGNPQVARGYIDDYNHWVETGESSWPYV